MLDQEKFKKIINVNAPILITGPSGTGKSQLAHKIFSHSKINRDKFLVLHLASIKDDLVEGELFGHKKGAFTGATENRIGYFQEVGTGTLFLDEVGELSLESQKKLLYILEEKKFTPVGSTIAHEFKGRLIVATNKNLKEMVVKGLFREDLYYRLNVFHLELDSISADKEKLRSEIHILFGNMKNFYNKNHLRLNSEVENLLVNCEWPGNYRELKNCLEYMVVMSEGLVVKMEDLPKCFLQKLNLNQASGEVDFIANFPQNYNLAIEKFEEWYFRAMLNHFAGKVNFTARKLGVSKTTLINKARKYQINTLKIRAEQDVSEAA